MAGKTTSIRALSEELGVGWEYIEIGTCTVPKQHYHGKQFMNKTDALLALKDYFRRKAKENADKARKVMSGADETGRGRGYKKNAYTWNKRYLHVVELLEKEGKEYVE